MSDELHKLQDFSSAGLRLGNIDDGDKFFTCLYEEIKNLIPNLDGFFITKYQNNKRYFIYQFCVKQNNSIKIQSRKVDGSLTEFVIRTRKPLLLVEGDKSFREQNHINPADPELGNYTSGMIAPIFFQGQPLGTLNAFTYQNEFRYSQEHLTSLQIFANQVAAVIHARDQLDEVTQLTHAASALAKAHGKDDVLKAIVEEAHNLIESEFTGLILLEKDGSLKKILPVMPAEFFNRFEDPRQYGGLTRHVVETREPRVIPDTSQDPLVKLSVRNAGIRSMLVFPLLHENQILGVLYAHTFALRNFSEHDVKLWTTFATQAAATLAEATRKEQEKEGYRRLALELGNLNDKVDMKETMEQVALSAKNIFQADSCRLACVEPATGRIRDWAWAPDDRIEYKSENDPRPEGITHHVIQSKQPIFRSANQINTYPQPHPSMVALGLKSVASLPLVYNGRTIGVLHCNYINSIDPFDSQLKALMEAYTARAAAALNRTYRDQLHEGWRNLEHRIFTGQEIDEIIQAFTEQAQQSFQADFAVFFPYSPSLSKPTSDRQEEKCIVVGDLRRDWETPKGGIGGGIHQEVEQNADGFLIVNNLKSQGGRFNSRLAVREGIKAFIAIRLMVSNPEYLPVPQLAGILFLNFRQTTNFENSDLVELKSAGSLVAAAILRLNLQFALQKSNKQRITQLQMVNDTIRDIKLGHDGLSLDLVAERAAVALSIDACTILVYDKKKKEFSTRGDYGLLFPNFEGRPREIFKELYMEQNEPTTISNIQADKIMRTSKFVAREGIQSTIVCPLRIEGESLGLFFANYRHAKDFSNDDVTALTLIGDFAALVLHINTLGTALAESRQRLDKHLFLVWVSMIEDTWRHSIIQKSSAIRNNAASLKQITGNKKLQVEKWDKVSSYIREIDRLADEINNAPPRVPSSWEMQTERVPLAALLQEVAERENKPLASTTGYHVTVEARIDALEDAQVLGYRRWLIYCLEILIQNARAALPKGGQVCITGRQNGTHAEIRIQDNGIGVSEEVRHILFKKKISEKKDKNGLGIGSLLAATIVENHEGSIELERPGPGDTTVLIRLPIINQEYQE